MKTITNAELPMFAAEMARRCKVTITTWDRIGWFAKLLAGRFAKKMDSALSEMDSLFRPMCFPVFGRFFVVLNFEPGCQNIPALRQAEILTHECQHAMDIRKYIARKPENGKSRNTAPNWYANYLNPITGDTFRAWAEGTPNTAQAELVYDLTGRYPNPVCDYDAYLIRDSSAKRMFRDGCETRKQAVMEQGRDWLATQDSARVAIDILRF